MNTAEMSAQQNINRKPKCRLSNSEKPFVASLRSQNGYAAHVYDVRSHGANVRSEFHSPNLGSETIKIQIIQ